MSERVRLRPAAATNRAVPEVTGRLERRTAEMADAEVSGPRVLVLLAAYNGAPWIPEQLESILRQEGVDTRIAVRDDGSTDGTPEEVGRFAGGDRVRVSRATVPSGSAAQNFFALMRENAAEDFDFVALADQDDIWNRDKLSRACRALAEDRAVGYSSSTVAAWADGRESVLRQVGTATPSDFLFEGAGQGCTFVLSAEFYGRVRSFVRDHQQLTQTVYYHDWAVYALARAWGMRWTFDSKPSMRYRQHGGNDTCARTTVAGIAKRLSLIKRGWYRAQLCGIAELCSAAAPTNATVTAWCALLPRPESWRRRLQIARFCLRGGRRRTLDNAIVALAALAGWV